MKWAIATLMAVSVIRAGTITIHVSQPNGEIVEGHAGIIPHSDPLGESGSPTRILPLQDGKVQREVPAGTYEVVLHGFILPEQILLDGTQMPLGRLVIDATDDHLVQFILPNTYRISGEVKQEDGAPISNIELVAEVHGKDTWTHPRTKSRGDGRFFLQVPAKALSLHAVPGGAYSFSPEVYSVDSSGEYTFIATPSDSKTIAGTVLDAREGHPLEGFRVQMSPSCRGIQMEYGSSIRESATSVDYTNSDGAFQVRCPSHCPFTVSASQDRPSQYRGKRKSLEAGACEHDLVFELERGGVLSGVVEDSEGKPIPGLHLRLNRGKRHETTDENGRFSFSALKGGDYSVQVAQVPAEEHKGLVIEMEPQEIERGEEKEIELEARRGGVICAVTLDRVANPLRIDSLTVFRGLDDEKPIQKSVHKSIERDPIERMCSEPLAPGEYLVQVGGDSFSQVWFPGVLESTLAIPVTIDAEEEHELGPIFFCPGDESLTPCLEPPVHNVPDPG